MKTKLSVPKAGSKGFSLAVLPTRAALEEAIAMNGKCKPRKCWHYVAINKLMEELSPGDRHYVRVDAGHIKLNYKGWRYVSDTPQHVKRSLMLFDAGAYANLHVRQYKLRFRRTTKILPYTEERKKQIYDARQRRIDEGRDYYPPPPKALRDRIAGFSSIV